MFQSTEKPVENFNRFCHIDFYCRHRKADNSGTTQENTIQMTANGLDVLQADSAKTVMFRNGVHLMMKQVIWAETDYQFIF